MPVSAAMLGIGGAISEAARGICKLGRRSSTRSRPLLSLSLSLSLSLYRPDRSRNSVKLGTTTLSKSQVRPHETRYPPADDDRWTTKQRKKRGFFGRFFFKKKKKKEKKKKKKNGTVDDERNSGNVFISGRVFVKTKACRECAAVRLFDSLQKPAKTRYKPSKPSNESSKTRYVASVEENSTNPPRNQTKNGYKVKLGTKTQ